MSSELADALLYIGVDNNKLVSTGDRNYKKLAKYIKLNITKAIYEVKKSSLVAFNIKQVFIQLR